MYHTYIDNCYTESQVKAMQDKDSGSRTFEDFISLDDLKYLQGMIEKVDYPEVGKTSKYAGASYHDPQGKILKEIFDEPLKKIIGDYELIINTTPVGTYPNTKECPNINFDYITKNHILFDLTYNPKKTKFLTNGKVKGAKTINGYQMLIYQAEKSWSIWNEIN